MKLLMSTASALTWRNNWPDTRAPELSSVLPWKMAGGLSMLQSMSKGVIVSAGTVSVSFDDDLINGSDRRRGAFLTTSAKLGMMWFGVPPLGLVARPFFVDNYDVNLWIRCLAQAGSWYVAMLNKYQTVWNLQPACSFTLQGSTTPVCLATEYHGGYN